MSIINQLNCGESFRNVGYSGCVLDPKNIVGVLVFPSKQVFTQSQINNFAEVLQSFMYADNGVNRAFPISGIATITDNSGEPVVETLDNGVELFVRDSPYNFTMRYIDGALCKHSALRTLNGQNRNILIWTSDNMLLGAKDVHNNITTIPSIFHAQGWKPTSGSNANQYLFRISFDQKWLNESLGFVQLDFDIAQIPALQDLVVVDNTFNPTSGLANVYVRTYCGATDMYDTFNTQLAVVGAWVATNASTGGVITVTTVTKDVSNKRFNVTVDVNDADYPSGGGAIHLKLAAPSVLAGLGVEGYDSLAAQLDVPVS